MKKLEIGDLPEDDGTRANAFVREMLRSMAEAGWIMWDSPMELSEAARAAYEPNEAQQAERTRSRYDYTQGPMYYLGQQIERAMQDAGYPAKIVECYRSPSRQTELYEQRPRVTKAKAFESAHQYYCAVDIVHPAKGWAVSEAYWDVLSACVRNVALKFDVELDHGHYWHFRDSAHIQLADWRAFKKLVGERVPSADDLDDLFSAVLPDEHRRYMKRLHDKGKAPDDRSAL